MGIWDKFYEKARSFFTGEEGTSSENAEPKTRCYYDLLEVHREATDDDIKKAFKKLALRWHPDKNQGREQECAAYFVLIQQAYEVLSDPQERAFYDRHRENILYQNTDGPDERKDTGIKLDPYMSTFCWKGVFTSEEERIEKFYSVYRDLFHQLAAEEYEYIEDPEERNYPVFGTFTSDYEAVVAPFYAFWLNFSTQRSFAWLDKWDLREAPDRYSARVMEKENRKNREQGRKQRNEEVRKLVEFIRRHDRRVELARQRQNERNEAIQKKVEEQRQKTIRRNLEKLENFEVDEEAHREHLMDLELIEQMLDAEFGTIKSGKNDRENNEEGSSNTEEEGDDFKCIVCDKSFKSRKMLDNHQRSKKHRQVVELLRTHMREEDQKLFEEEAKGSSQYEEEEGEVLQKKGKRKKKRADNKDEGKKNDIMSTSEEKRNLDEMVEVEKLKEGGEKEPSNDEEKGKTKATVKTIKKARRKGTERKGDEPKEPTGPVPSQCVTCGEEFESKSKLHGHLKESGHAVLKTLNTIQAGRTDGQRKAVGKGKRNKE